jgi:PadR family transcriptional regulator, regulatory protein PadR
LPVGTVSHSHDPQKVRHRNPEKFVHVIHVELLLVPLCFDNKLLYCLCRSSRGKESMTEERLELPQGTLDLLILKALALEPMHGWAVSERLQQISQEALRVQQGSLYPALHRLERRGWIKAQWAISENNRRAKYYRLTATGKKRLSAEAQRWARLSAAVAFIMQTS